MKSLAISIAMIGSIGVPAFASEMSVEITSFVRAGLRTRSAELCGKVLNMDQPWVVAKVKVDAKDKNPGYYNALVGSEAKFCVNVVTHGGSAEISLASLDGEVLSPPMKSNFETQKGNKQ